jgi:hypothetical protein
VYIAKKRDDDYNEFLFQRERIGESIIDEKNFCRMSVNVQFEDSRMTLTFCIGALLVGGASTSARA